MIFENVNRMSFVPVARHCSLLKKNLYSSQFLDFSWLPLLCYIFQVTLHTDLYTILEMYYAILARLLHSVIKFG